MLLFKKSSRNRSQIPKQKKKKHAQKDAQPKKKTVTKIGLGPGTTSIREALASSKNTTDTKPAQKQDDLPQTDLFEEDFYESEDTSTKAEEKSGKKKPEELKKQKPKKVLFPKDLKGKPVYLEDTGEKIGVIYDVVYDEEKRLIGYKIKDEKTDTILSFPPEQFDEDKNGFIFVPSWYTKGLKSIEKMEFKDRITPELPWLLSDKALSADELYKIFVKHDQEIQDFLQEATGMRELLQNRLKVLEKERLGLKDNLMDLTEKRLIKDIDRKEFSEIVMEHRRKVNVLDVNIQKCKDLLQRLDKTSFGMLSDLVLSRIEGHKPQLTAQKQEHKEQMQKPAPTNPPPRIDLYKDKYFLLKHRYDGLEEEYNELRDAVEKVINKSEGE